MFLVTNLTTFERKCKDILIAFCMYIYLKCPSNWPLLSFFSANWKLPRYPFLMGKVGSFLVKEQRLIGKFTVCSKGITSCLSKILIPICYSTIFTWRWYIILAFDITSFLLSLSTKYVYTTLRWYGLMYCYCSVRLVS